MKRNITKIFFASALFVSILVGSYSCTTDDTLSELEVRRMIEEALRENNGNLSESDVRRIIEEVLRENNGNLSESDVRRIIEEVLSENNGNLSESDVRRMIEEALRENNQNLEFTQWEIVNIQAKQSDWQWNVQERRYEAIYLLPELTEFIYENGAVLGYLFLGQQGVDEVQKILPYVHTYYATDTEGNITETFTETISYDVMYQSGGNSDVAFFIQASDVYEDTNAPQTYNFRIVLIW